MTGHGSPYQPIGDVLSPVEGVLDLRSFDPAFLTDHFPCDRIETAFDPGGWFGYPPVEGASDLRLRLADSLSVDPENIVVTDGASQALYLAMLTGLAAGDHVFAPSPVFPAYTRMATLRECIPHTYSCKDEPDAIIAQLNTAGPRMAKGLVINSPHNPTGHTWSAGQLAHVIEEATRRGILTILDDTYHWTEADASQITRLAKLASNGACAEHTIAVASLGKYLCLPGLRLGFAVSRNTNLIGRMVEAKRHLSHASCGSSQRIALALLQDREWSQSRSRLLRTLGERRQQLESRLRRLNAKTESPSCGFYLYAEHIEALKERDILGIGGRVFDAASDQARYCLAVGTQTWQRVLDALDAPV